MPNWHLKSWPWRTTLFTICLYRARCGYVKADCSLNYQLNTEFGEGHTFTATFNGPWDRYKRFKSITDAFAKEASKASARMNLSLDFQEGLDLQDDRFSMMKEILTTLEIGKIQVTDEPKKEEEQSW